MMNFKTKFNLLLILLLIFVLAMSFSACVNGSKPISEMTQKERLVVILSTYNSQYSDYMRMTGYIKDADGKWIKNSSPKLSDSQKSILRQKKIILSKLYPLISLYQSYEVSGRAVDRATEAEIFNMLDSLALLVPD